MKRLWIAFSLVMVLSFLVLGWIGTRIYQEMPPIPAKVVTPDGTVLIAEGEIAAGQNVWQSLGGMQVGSVWGHGSYVAPDWTADWLHREATFIRDHWAAAEFGAEHAKLDGERQAQLQGRLAKQMRTNTYAPTTGAVTVSPVRAEAFQSNLKYYSVRGFGSPLAFRMSSRRLCAARLSFELKGPGMLRLWPLAS